MSSHFPSFLFNYLFLLSSQFFPSYSLPSLCSSWKLMLSLSVTAIPDEQLPVAGLTTFAYDPLKGRISSNKSLLVSASPPCISISYGILKPVKLAVRTNHHKSLDNFFCYTVDNFTPGAAASHKLYFIKLLMSCRLLSCFKDLLYF